VMRRWTFWAYCSQAEHYSRASMLSTDTHFKSTDVKSKFYIKREKMMILFKETTFGENSEWQFWLWKVLIIDHLIAIVWRAIRGFLSYSIKSVSSTKKQKNTCAIKFS
jgi:hypothetical protein